MHGCNGDPTLGAITARTPTLCARPPLWKDAQEENTAPGAAGSDGGVTGKLNASSSSLTPTGVVGISASGLIHQVKEKS